MAIMVGGKVTVDLDAAFCQEHNLVELGKEAQAWALHPWQPEHEGEVLAPHSHVVHVSLVPYDKHAEVADAFADLVIGHCVRVRTWLCASHGEGGAQDMIPDDGEDWHKVRRISSPRVPCGCGRGGKTQCLANKVDCLPGSHQWLIRHAFQTTHKPFCAPHS